MINLFSGHTRRVLFRRQCRGRDGNISLEFGQLKLTANYTLPPNILFPFRILSKKIFM